MYTYTHFCFTSCVCLTYRRMSLVCQYLYKDKDQNVFLFQTHYNNVQNKCENTTTIIDPIQIWVVVAVEVDNLSDNKTPSVLSSHGMSGICKTLQQQSGGIYTFEPDFTRTATSTFSELNFDVIRVLSDICGNAVIHEKVDPTTGKKNSIVISIKTLDDDEIMQSIVNLSHGENAETDDTNLQPSQKIVEIPYFEFCGKVTSSYYFVDVPFLVKKINVSKKQTSDTLFKSVSPVNKALFTEHVCFLRDYTYLKQTCDNTTSRFTDTKIYARIDPISNENVKNSIPQDFKTGSISVDQQSGCLNLTSIAFDQWFTRDIWGQYDTSITEYMDIIYIGYHDSVMDEQMVGFKHSFFKMYCLPIFFEKIKMTVEKSTGHILPNLDLVTFFSLETVSVPKIRTILRPCKNLTVSDRFFDEKYDSVDILLYWEAINTYNNIFLACNDGYSDFELFKERFEMNTYISKKYVDFICMKLVPFLFDVDKKNFTLTCKNKHTKFRLVLCTSENDQASKALQITKAFNCVINPMVFHYGNRNLQKAKIHDIDYKKFEFAFCCADLDDSIEEMLNRKPDLVPYIDFGYENLLSDGKSILDIAIALARLCHASIHEVFHGGKMLWHMRAMEYLFCKHGKAKPNRLALVKKVNFGTTRTDAQQADPFLSSEKWRVIGAHVGDAKQGWFSANDSTLPQSTAMITDNKNMGLKAVFLDYDGYYNSIVCEYQIGFLCHVGTLDVEDKIKNTKILLANQVIDLGLPVTSLSISNNTKHKNVKPYLSQIFMMKEMYTHFVELLEQRRSLKKEISTSTSSRNNPQLMALYIALKLASNSFYGCCAKEKSPISSKVVANCITSFGRRGILAAHTIVHDDFNIDVGMSDTDGLCIFKPKDLDVQEIVDKINSLYAKKFIKIAVEEQFEAIYIKNKKSYVGIRNIQEWERQTEINTELIKSSLTEHKIEYGSFNLYHESLMLIALLQRSKLFSWTVVRSEFEKNTKCKGMWNKKWSSAEIMCFLLAILSYSKYILRADSKAVYDSVYEFCEQLCNGITYEFNPIAIAAGLSTEILEPEHYVDVFSANLIIEKPKEDTAMDITNPSTRHKSSANITKSVSFSRCKTIITFMFEEIVKKNLRNDISIVHNIDNRNQENFVDKMVGRCCLGIEALSLKDIKPTRNIIKIFVKYPCQLVQILCASMIASDEKFNAFVNDTTIKDNQLSFMCTVMTSKGKIENVELNLDLKLAFIYPVTLTSIKYFHLLSVQRQENVVDVVADEPIKIFNLLAQVNGPKLFTDMKTFVKCVLIRYKNLREVVNGKV